MGNLIGLWWYVLSKDPWRRTFLSPPTSLCWDVHGTNNSHLKKDRAITLVQPESTRRPSQPAWCCQDFVKFGCFVGCEAEDTHPERGYKSWDTHSKRPLFTVGPIVSVWMMLPQNTPGAAWERKEETHVVRPDSFGNKPEGGHFWINTQLSALLSSPRVPKSKHSDHQHRRLLWVRLYPLAQRNFREERPVAARGALRRARPLPWSRAEMEISQVGVSQFRSE